MANGTPGGTIFNLPVPGAAALASQVDQFGAPVNALETGLSGFCVATSPATPNNTYLVNPVPAVVLAGGSPLTEGTRICFQANFFTGGTPNVTVNGVFTAPLVRPDGNPIQAGDVTSGQVVEARWDGSNWRMTFWPPWNNGYLSGTLSGLVLITGSDNTLLNDVQNFRLSVDPTNPVTGDTVPQTSATLYAIPWNGDSSLGAGPTIVTSSTPLSLAAGSLSGDGVYDIFISDSTGLYGVQWTGSNDRTASPITRVTGIWTNGNNGDRYIGSVYLSGGLFQDDPSARYVWNNDNRLPRPIFASLASYSMTSNAWADVLSVPFLTGVLDECGGLSASATGYATGDSGSGSLCQIALSVNGTTPDPTGGYGQTIAVASVSTFLAGTPPQIGLGAVNLLQRGSINGYTVTLTSPDTNANTIKGIIWA